MELWEKHHWSWHNKIVSLLKQMARDTIEGAGYCLISQVTAWVYPRLVAKNRTAQLSRRHASRYGVQHLQAAAVDHPVEVCGRDAD